MEMLKMDPGLRPPWTAEVLGMQEQFSVRRDDEPFPLVTFAGMTKELALLRHLRRDDEP
jgi:hypothetical protein